MNTNTPAMRQQASIFDILASDKAAAEMERIAGSAIDVPRFAQISTTTIKANWSSLKDCTPFSIFTAVLEAAQLDLDTSPGSGQWYFVPYKSTCVGILGYRGMLRLAYRSGAVAKIDAKLVYAGDDFDFVDGHDGPKWHHRPHWQTGKDKGAIRFAYAHATLANGEVIFKVADQDRIKAARAASRSGKTWQAHPGPMTVKTAVRELWKWLPRDAIESKVAYAVDDDAIRDVDGMTAGRVSSDWARAAFELPPETLAELEPAAGLEPGPE